jgi:hypothetical protein
MRDANLDEEDMLKTKALKDRIKNLLMPQKDDEESKNYEQIAQILNDENPEAENKITVDMVQKAIHKSYVKDKDFAGLYQLMLKEHMLEITKLRAAASKHKNQGGIWRHFPRKDKLQPEVDENGKQLSTDEVFERNLDECTELSTPQNWCTTRERNGIPYLNAGDFYVYIVNGSAEVGIRFEGEKIAEIAGPQLGGDREVPRKFWREVLQFVKKNNWEDRITGYFAKRHWEELLKERNLNQSFFQEDGTIDMAEIDEFAKLIITKPELYNRVDFNQFAAYKEFDQIKDIFQDACRQAWAIKIAQLNRLDALAAVEKMQTDLFPEMPDFVIKDPRFIVSIHARLANSYKDNPNYLQYVLPKVPQHWEIYPEGKEIFKEAVLAKLRTGIFWKGRAVGMSKKSAADKNAAITSSAYYNEMMKIIADFAADLNADPEFIAAMEAANNEAINAAVKEGFVSREMPQDTMENFLDDPENYETLKNKVISQILESPNVAKTESRKQTLMQRVYTQEYIESYLRALAPGIMRRKDKFTKLAIDILKGVLFANILNFPTFAPEFKRDDSIYAAYRTKYSNLVRKNFMWHIKANQSLLRFLTNGFRRSRFYKRNWSWSG